MTEVRDLGYQPYQGRRLPPSATARVMLRHAMRQCWASWLVKVAVFIGWIPLIVMIAFAGISGTDTAQEAADRIAALCVVQVWIFLLPVGAGAGAGAIARDFSIKAFPFYFAKPVTRLHYLGGRIGAAAFWCATLVLAPALLYVFALTGFVPAEARLETVGLLLPAVAQSAIAALSCACISIGISSMSRSRALTSSAWLVLFVIPHILAVIVENVAEWPWLRMLSLPALLTATGDGLFSVSDPGALSFFHALPALLVLSALGLALAMRRLQHPELIP